MQAPTPAANIRKPPSRRTGKALIGLGIVFGIALWGSVILAGFGAFDKATVAEQPHSVVHRMAVQLERSGEIDEFRAVEPAEGWDTEYEIGDGDGSLRVRDEGTPNEEFEFEVLFDDGLDDAVQDVSESYGFIFED